MTEKTRSGDFKPKFGAFILETLTMGMYGESRNALREYVQNSFDSLREAVEDELITASEMRVEVSLDIANGAMIIRDNGSGIRSSVAADVLVSIGMSRKDFRRNAGFRGIGRLAGIVFCDELSFVTKAKGDPTTITVTFDAKMLRELLEPRAEHEDATRTLERCISVTSSETDALDDHFFEVRLTGFHQPPKECQSIDSLKAFLSQVSPLPYSVDFKYANDIQAVAKKHSSEIEVIHLFVREGTGEYEELFKPYRDTYSVKRVQAPLSGIDYPESRTGKWWGWIGQKKVSGAIKDMETRGIRVRSRNIQIDGNDIMKEIFSNSYDDKSSRLSYARFAEYYVGEIFMAPGSVVPNARRDGFEEDANWIAIRRELSEVVGEIYGLKAYKTSAADTVSIPKLEVRLAQLEAESKRLLAERITDPDLLMPFTNEAKVLQQRIEKASTFATDEESSQVLELSRRLGAARHELNRLAVKIPRAHDCQDEVAKATSDLSRKIFRALRDGLGPSEWPKVRSLLREVTGEDFS
jgi:uncharacterized small protein (DUF1192 family)